MSTTDSLERLICEFTGADWAEKSNFDKGLNVALQAFEESLSVAFQAFEESVNITFQALSDEIRPVVRDDLRDRKVNLIAALIKIALQVLTCDQRMCIPLDSRFVTYSAQRQTSLLRSPT
jgi:hypothetical protein